MPRMQKLSDDPVVRSNQLLTPAPRVKTMPKNIPAPRPGRQPIRRADVPKRGAGTVAGAAGMAGRAAGVGAKMSAGRGALGNNLAGAFRRKFEQ